MVHTLLTICLAYWAMGDVTGGEGPTSDSAAPIYTLGQPGVVDWRAAIEAGNHEEAAHLLVPRARKGDPEAALHLGVLHYRGLGTTRDFREAAWWFDQSAKKGNPTAMNNLGTMYRDGNGVCRDYLKARDLFERAAMHGYAAAQNNLAAMLADGQGGPRDVIEAYAWMTAASDQGQAMGQFNMGKIQAVLSRAELYEGLSRAEELHDQIDECRRKSGECGMRAKAPPTLAASDTKDPTALYTRAYEAYRYGDYKTALRIVRPLANAGNSHAQVLLGLLYSRGLGVAPSEATALSWYRKAAKKNDGRALNNLGVFYRDGRGMAKNYLLAVDYFRRAALLNDSEAQNNLGLLFADGQGVSPDPVEAYAWLELSAKQGNGTASANLGVVRRQLAPGQEDLGNLRAEELRRQIAALPPGELESD